mmetsp:Transcript_162871/g.522179  ORF Transcript_162871/g.522179 Transcript_162871/m.522179 type:complete len:399 (+) Transcript_162871:865-2061(+)
MELRRGRVGLVFLVRCSMFNSLFQSWLKSPIKELSVERRGFLVGAASGPNKESMPPSAKATEVEVAEAPRNDSPRRPAAGLRRSATSEIAPVESGCQPSGEFARESDSRPSMESALLSKELGAAPGDDSPRGRGLPRRRAVGLSTRTGLVMQSRKDLPAVATAAGRRGVPELLSVGNHAGGSDASSARGVPSTCPRQLCPRSEASSSRGWFRGTTRPTCWRQPSPEAKTCGEVAQLEPALARRPCSRQIEEANSWRMAAGCWSKPGVRTKRTWAEGTKTMLRCHSRSVGQCIGICSDTGSVGSGTDASQTPPAPAPVPAPPPPPPLAPAAPPKASAVAPLWDKGTPTAPSEDCCAAFTPASPGAAERDGDPVRTAVDDEAAAAEPATAMVPPAAPASP